MANLVTLYNVIKVGGQEAVGKGGSPSPQFLKKNTNLFSHPRPLVVPIFKFVLFGDMIPFSPHKWEGFRGRGGSDCFFKAQFYRNFDFLS